METSQQLLESFLEMLSSVRFSSQNTLEAYKTDLTWLQSRIYENSSCNFQNVTSDILYKIFSTIDISHLSPATRARRIVATRQFFQFLFLEFIRTDDPSEILESPKLAQKLPKVMSEQQINHLISYARDEAQRSKGIKLYKNTRLYCILTLLYSSGLRISEVCSLKFQSVKLTSPIDGLGLVRVKGKGSKERIIPLNEEGCIAVANWIDMREQKHSKAGNIYMFPANSTQGYVARQVIARHIKALATRAGLESYEIYPHIFRHSFASHMLKNGCDLVSLQKILGHNNISTTQIYTHILDDELYKAIDQYHPLAQPANK